MFGSDILDVAIGVIFVYVIVSIFCTALREGIEAVLKTRAAYLEHGIRELLYDTSGTELAQQMYNHPLIYGLFSGKYRESETASTAAAPSAANSSPPAPAAGQKPKWSAPWVLARGNNLPSYIPSKNFALALMDLVARGKDFNESAVNAPVISLQGMRENVARITNTKVQRVLLTAIDAAQGDLNRVQENLEGWYDSAMDRVSGWYKRSTQSILFALGLLIAVGMNINTITLADYLYRNDVARKTLVAAAGNAANDNELFKHNYQDLKADLTSMGLPIGWDIGWGAPRQHSGDLWNAVGGPILGWLMTALAATLGAPFWFDILNKVMVIRSTVKPHEKSPEEGSEDRQLPTSKRSESHPAPPPITAVPVAAAPIAAAPVAAAPVAAAPIAAAPIAAAPVAAAPIAAADVDDTVDGCAVAIEGATGDAALPAAKGGVAP